ncbi:MAG: NAD+ synthase [Bdellovibrionota bacterium]
MRIAICQIGTAVGAFTSNVEKIHEFLKKAAECRVDMAVFPELCVSSYPPLDLLDRPDFWRANATALEALEKKFPQIKNLPEAIVLGSLIENPKPVGKPIQNAAIVYQNGEKVHRQAKRLLPTYDVFDEFRYFEPADQSVLWSSRWGKIGISICEDAWFEDEHAGRRLYEKDPAIDLRGADLVLNLSASPFEVNKRMRRHELLARFVKRIQAPAVYVNQVGANDEILFDGGSLFLSKDGSVQFEMPAFREGMAVVEIDLGKTAAVHRAEVFSYVRESDQSAQWGKMVKPPSTDDELDLIHKALVTGIRDYFRKTGFKKAVLGLSGGIDSAVVACLAAEALGPRNVLGVSMPSQFSSSHSLADAEGLAKATGIEHRTLSLKFIYTALLMELKPAFMGLAADATEENVQARLRGLMLMALANKRCALVLTTGNKSELAVGYCTTYGDMAGALAPIGDLYKTRVYDLARRINSRHSWIPESTLTKAPSAELRPNQTDQDTLPPYEVLDHILELYFEGLADESEIIKAGHSAELVKKVLSLVRTSEFKRRQAAPVLKVSSKAFGLGRRIPVAKSY